MRTLSFSAPQGLLQWMNREGTAIGEFLSGSLAVHQAARALTLFEGKSMAPFLMSPDKSSSSWFLAMWVVLLLLYGAFALCIMVAGEVRKNRGADPLPLMRGYISLGGALTWMAVGVATLYGTLPGVAAIGYFVVSFGIFCRSSILFVQDRMRDFSSDV